MLYTSTAFQKRAKRRQSLAGVGIFFMLLPYFFAGLAFGLQAEEYQIKSAYLEKITRFVRWPEKAEKAEKSFFIIGIAGASQFNRILERDYRNREIKGKPVRIVNIASAEAIKDCDLLFISSSAKERLDKYIRTAERFHVLTIGDTPGFAEKGVHINFYTERQKVRFAINPDAMKRAGLNAGSLLLDYAKIIKPDS